LISGDHKSRPPTLTTSYVIVPPADSGFYLGIASRRLAPFIYRKEAQPMIKPNLGVANQAISRILELSADVHIQRQATVRDSVKFHNLTGAIAAYGKVLAILTALRHGEEFHAIIGQHEVPGCVAAFQCLAEEA
jgi:hypothetical protein